MSSDSEASIYLTNAMQCNEMEWNEMDKRTTRTTLHIEKEDACKLYRTIDFRYLKSAPIVNILKMMTNKKFKKKTKYKMTKKNLFILMLLAFFIHVYFFECVCFSLIRINH